jgi:hypothetical protein
MPCYYLGMNNPQPNQKQVSEFIDSISDTIRREDCRQLVTLIEEITGQEPALWGKIIGFGHHHYKYESGREGDTMKIGLAPRKQALTVYGVILYDNEGALLEQLGPHERGKGCLYIKQLADINQEILKKMLSRAWEEKREEG